MSTTNLKNAGPSDADQILNEGPQLDIKLFERSRESIDRKKLDTLYEKAKE